MSKEMKNLERDSIFVGQGAQSLRFRGFHQHLPPAATFVIAAGLDLPFPGPIGGF
ncbi:MAG: hypothetical protein J6O51_02185 [Bacteroidales bacterium]|nr:hypothetical protein [Bacteroidales bacterium]